MSAFLAELQRRHVYKVGAMYCVAGWLLVQIVTQVLPVFDVSALGQRILVLIVVAGFPVALVLAWLFDITSEGIVRTPDASDEREPHVAARRRRSTDRNLNYVLGCLLLCACLYPLAERIGWLAPKTQTATDSDKSIAVLPFDNLSDDKSNTYFAEGVQDEILTRLSKIGALKVISRTSARQYGARPANLPEIARQLGVANILEGSVQKAGDAVHINVQLIRAATDEHLWAESYDRKLEDIFAVEGEVAGTIAQALKARLSGAEQQTLAQQPTANSEAYEAYLRGVTLSDSSMDFDAERKAEAAFAQAISLDPGFMLAWAKLAEQRGYLYSNGIENARYTADSVREATDAATRLAPEAGEAQLAQGYYSYRVLRDYPRALQAFETAAKSLPNSAQAWWSMALVERRLGHWDKAVAHATHALDLDPRNANMMVTLAGEMLAPLHRLEEARGWLKRSLQISPGQSFAVAYLAAAYQYEGSLEEAEATLQAIPEAGEDMVIASQRVYQRLLEHRYDAAIAECQPLLAHLPDGEPDWAAPLMLYLAEAQYASGNRAASQATAQRLVALLQPLAERIDENDYPSVLAQAYAYAGQPEQALLHGHRAVELWRNDTLHLPSAQLALAQVQAMAGDHASALAALRQSLQTPNGVTPASLQFDPAWDSLRGEPDFERLAESALVILKTAGP